jgi:hypothetical protein
MRGDDVSKVVHFKKGDPIKISDHPILGRSYNYEKVAGCFGAVAFVIENPGYKNSVWVRLDDGSEWVIQACDLILMDRSNADMLLICTEE